MAESTVDEPDTAAPTASESASASASAAAEPRAGLLSAIRTHPGIATAIGLVAFSTIFVRVANTRPGFDPYGWLVWGHETLVGALNTNAAPSWKPLPYLFTVPYALAGHYQVWLWLITSVAISLAGPIFAGRIVYRLVGRTAAGDRRPALFAAAFAGVGSLLITDYFHYVLSAQSDPLIAALVLGAIDCHLSGRRRWALVCLVLASLGRPEAWPFAGLYGLWLWRSERAMRWWLVGGLVLVLALWFGIPGLTSHSFFQAGSNALHSGRALTHNKITGTIGRFKDLQPLVLEVVALLSFLWAVVRRDRITVVLALGAALWVVVEIAFALHGWPGVPRYLFPAAAVTAVVAGVGIGRALTAFPRLPFGADALRSPAAARWLGVALVAIVSGALVPTAISRARAEHGDVVDQQRRTASINQLSTLVSRLGGPDRFKQCGEPLTRLEYQSIVAWTLRINVATVGFKYGQAEAHGNPLVLITPSATGGWTVQPVHQVKPDCTSLSGSIH
jgi:hypothetical protein